MSPFCVSCSAQVSRILPLRTTSATGSRSVPILCFVFLRPAHVQRRHTCCEPR